MCKPKQTMLREGGQQGGSWRGASAERALLHPRTGASRPSICFKAPSIRVFHAEQREMGPRQAAPAGAARALLLAALVCSCELPARR